MYFSQEFLDFFSGLRQNNHKPWFDEHRKQYEKHVKKPFKQFVEEMILAVQQFDPDVVTTPKDSIFRINRDIRFSKDKTPYKPHASAVLAVGGKKSEQPGYYLQLSDTGVWVGGGCYNLSKDNLFKIRQEIVYEMDSFRKVTEDAAFQEAYGQVQGAKNKILPTDFKEEAQNQPLLYNKQFYYMATLPSATILSDNLAATIGRYFEKGLPLNQFLRRAMQG